MSNKPTIYGFCNSNCKYEVAHKDETQIQHTTKTATLSSSGWSGNNQTVSVEGVTSSNTVLVSPDPSSAVSYAESEVVCTEQRSGTLTFHYYGKVPASAFTVNVVILGVQT